MKKLFVFASAVLMAAAVNADVTIDMSTFQIQGDPDQVEAAEKDGVVTVDYELGPWASGGVYFDFAESMTNIIGIELKAKGGEFIGAPEDPSGDPQWIAFMIALQDEEGVNWYDPTPDLHLSEPAYQEWFDVKDYMPNQELWTSTATWACGEKPFTRVIVMANPMYTEKSSFEIKELVIKTQATGLSEVAAKAEAKKVMKDGKLFIQVNGREFTAAGMAL